MSYILMIWTAVAAAGGGGAGGFHRVEYSWRPIGEFHTNSTSAISAQQLCRDAARELGLKPENYRCVRSK
jgi:hypothetical protein